MNKIIKMKGFLLTMFLGFGLLGVAQTFTIQGTVVDSSSKRNLASATISIVKSKDSALVSFARSNDQGFFNVKSVPAGSYLISISYVGFLQQWIAFKTGKNAVIDLSKIYMQDASSLSTVTVTARRAPVVINGDSIEFNAENFKTAPNAVVEDLLKKMPGIEVDKSGAITVNGKTVTKVFVNGKEFFTGDPKMATRNLPADAIDKIQVYDRKSDQSMFTGIDDGNEETAINLKVKKDRNQSNFGKLTGGVGVPSRFDLRGNLNRINNDEQFSIIGSGNNINRQDFSARDFSSFSGGGGGGRPGGGGGGVTISFGGGGGGGNGGGGGEGVATTISGGGNYSNVFNDKRTDFNANLSLSDIDRLNTSHSLTQNLTPGNLFNRYDSSTSTSKNKQQSIGTTIDHKVSESFSYKLTPSIGSSNGTSNNESWSDTYLPDGTKTNNTRSTTSSATDAVNFNNTLLLKKRFEKKGRTISSTITNGYNTSNSNGGQYTTQGFYTGGIKVRDSILDQQNLRKGNTTTYSANVIYTEPLGKRSLLEMNAYLSQSIGSSSKKVYDKNSNGIYDVLNTRLTNEFNSEYTYSGGGMNYRTNQRKFNFASGFAIQNAKLNGENVSAKTKLNQNFKDILPSAMFRYNFSQTKNLNIDYRTSTNQPSLTQLQPVLDQSNINRQTIGNPDLKRSYQHNINIRFFSSKVISQKNFFAIVNASTTNNSIINYDSILPSRVTLSKPVNVNGAYRVFGSLNYGFGLKKIYSRVNFGLNTGLNNNISYTNGLLNTIVTKSFGPSIRYNFQIDEKIDLDLSARYSYNQTNNKINAALNTNYLTKVFSAEMDNYLPFNFLLNQSFNYTINSGRAEGFNTAIPIWNANFSKFFMKNKRAELKVSAFDILNKNAGISRNVSQNQIVDQYYNVINQYFMVSFIYSLQKSGLGGNGGKGVSIRM
ncbi:MAG: outer membrane beta-barrel protein [Sediminibacterium sp.]